MLPLPWNLSRHTLTQLCIWCCVAGQHWFSADRARGPPVRGLLQDPEASLLAVLLAVRPTVRVLHLSWYAPLQRSRVVQVMSEWTEGS